MGRKQVKTRARSTVVVFRELGGVVSETFVRNQVASYTRFTARLVHLRSQQGHDDPGEVLLLGRLRRKLLRGAGLSLGVGLSIRAARPRLLHIHFLLDACLLEPALHNLKCPVVVTCHGYDVTVRDDVLCRSPYRMRRELENRERTFELVSSFVCVSEYIQSRLIGLGCPMDKTVVIPIGIPISKGWARPSTERYLDGPILFVGRLVEKKGVDDMLRALARIDPAIRRGVRLIGDGPLRAELEGLARDLGVAVEFLGAQRGGVVESEMRRAALLCGPSKVGASGDSEGFGMVFLEAAANELPVVAYDSGGVSEAVVDGVTGILAEEGNVTALSNALSVLLTQPQLCGRMGQSGRSRVLAEFDIAQRSLDLERHYEALLRTKDREKGIDESPTRLRP